MKPTPIRWPRAVWFAAGIVVVALALGAMFVRHHAATPAHAAAAGTPTSSTAAMRVAIDPETGTLGMPTGDQAKALDLPAEPQGEAPVRTLADGTLQVDFQGRGRAYAVARVGADGKVATDCVTDANGARRFLLGAGAEKPVVDGREVK